MKLLDSLKRLMADEQAIGAVEYALILALIALAIVVAATGLGDSVVDRTNQAASDAAT